MAIRSVTPEEYYSKSERWKGIKGANVQVPVQEPEIDDAPSRGIISETLHALGGAATDEIPLAVAQTLEGMSSDGVPASDDKTWLGKFIAEQKTDISKRPKSKEYLEGKFSNKAIVEGIQSGAASVPIGIAGFGAGLGVAAITPADPVTKAAAGGIAAGLVSGAAMVPMAKNEFIRNVRDSLVAKNGPLDEDDWNQIKNGINTQANEYAAWEAGTEGLSEGLNYLIFKAPIGKWLTSVLGKGAANKILNNTLARVGIRYAGMTASEIPTEGLAGQKQDLLLAEQGVIPQPEGTQTEQYFRKVKEVAAPTAVSTLFLGGGMKAVDMLAGGMKKQGPTLTNEDNKFLTDIEQRLNNPEDKAVTPEVVQGMMQDKRFVKVKPHLQDILTRNAEAKEWGGDDESGPSVSGPIDLMEDEKTQKEPPVLQPLPVEDVEEDRPKRPPLTPGFQGPVQVNPQSGGWIYQEEPATQAQAEVKPSREVVVPHIEPGPAEQSAQVFQEELEKEDRIKQSRQGLELLKKQLREQSEIIMPEEQMLKVAIEDVKASRPGTRTRVKDPNGPGETWIGESSSYPEWMKGRGLTKRAVLNALEKKLLNKPLTENQQAIVDMSNDYYQEQIDRDSSHQEYEKFLEELKNDTDVEGREIEEAERFGKKEAIAQFNETTREEIPAKGEPVDSGGFNWDTGEQIAKVAKPGQAAGELTEDTKINGVTFTQLEDMIINDKPGMREELEAIKAEHGREGMQDLVNPGKIYARVRKRLVQEQGMDKAKASELLQKPFKLYEKRFKEVEGGIENVPEMRREEGQGRTEGKVKAESYQEEMKRRADEQYAGWKGKPEKKDSKFEVKEGVTHGPGYRKQGNLFGDKAKSQLELDFGAEREIAKTTDNETIPPAQRVTYSATGNIRSEARTLSSNKKKAKDEVATLISSTLSNRPNERFFVVSVTKDGTISEVFKYGVGSRAGAYIYPNEIAGHFLSNKDVADVYLIHNHPSGDTKPSQEDLLLVESISNLARASDVSVTGLVIGDGKYEEIGGGDGFRTIKPLKKKAVLIPVVEREYLIKEDSFKDRKQIKDSDSAKEAVFKYGKSKDGILLMDKKNIPVAFLPFTKGKTAQETTRELLVLQASSNASTAIIKNDDQGKERLEYLSALTHADNPREKGKAYLGDLAIIDYIKNGISSADNLLMGEKVSEKQTRYNTLMGETKLNISPPDLTSQAFRDNRKAVLHFRKLMRTAGLSKKQLDALDIEVKDVVKIIGDVRRSEKEHGHKIQDITKVLGSTTFNKIRTLVQFSSNQGLISAEDTAYHEAYHVAVEAALGTEKAQVFHDEFFNGNEENAAKSYSKFVMNEETTSIPKSVRKVFYMIKRMLNRIANGFKQSGYKTPEDFFRALYFGAYPNQEISGVNEFAQSIKLSLDKAVKKITDNPNFVKWFGNSKVVDENGYPLVVYHGTADEITTFKAKERGRTTSSESAKKGFFFTSNKRIAKGYSDFARPRNIDKLRQKYEHLERMAQKINTNTAWDKYQKAYAEYENSELRYSREGDGNIVEAYLSMKNPLIHDFDGNEFRDESYSSLIDKAMKNKKDGVILKNTYDGVGERGALENPLTNIYVAFHPTQIKSIYNQGTFDPNNPDIRLSISPDEAKKTDTPNIVYVGEQDIGDGKTISLYNLFGVEGQVDGDTVTENTIKRLGLIPDKGKTKLNIARDFHNDMDSFMGDAIDFVKGIPDTVKTRAATKAGMKVDSSAFDRYVKTPFHYFRKVPAAWGVFQDALKRSDHFWSKVDDLSKAPDGQYWTMKINQAKKQIPEEYKKLQAFFKYRDQNALGSKVVKKKKEDTYVLYGIPKGSKRRRVKMGEFGTESEAWEMAIQNDLSYLKKKGMSDQAIDAAESVMRIRHAGFNMLAQNMRDVIAKYEELGMDLPKYNVWVNGESVKVDLKLELARMGDIRGYYMPRSWKPGGIVMYAKKAGAHPRIETFDTVFFASNRKRDMIANEGYRESDIEIKKSGRMPEDVFDMAGQTVAVNAMLNKALSGLSQKDFKLSDFDLKGEFVAGPGKNHDFVLTGATNKKQGVILKGLGGKFHKASENEIEGWHFMNKPPGFKNKLAKALALSEVSKNIDQETAVLFAGGLAEQLGNVIKERGSRKHMIRRNDARGMNVWEGYEEDLDKGLAQYVRSLAAGEAKHVMAVNMVKHITGTDISWKDYKTMQEDAGEETPEYDDYLEFVKGRRIDPAQQANIFKDVTTYMKDVLRNQETVDRVIGVIRGLSVLKFLGLKLSALPVNMSAMVTTVPAAMKAYADIDISKAFKYMAKMSRLYVQYERYKRSRDSKLLSQKYIDLFAEIEKQGWGKPQFNREAISTLEGKVSSGYSWLIEKSMAPFAISETFNRMVTISASYEGLRAAGKTHEEAMEIAKDVSDHAHAVYGSANYPHLMRGENLAAQALKMGYVFKQFTHNYLQTMWDMGYNKRDAKATLWMAVSPMFLGGLGAFAGTAIFKSILQAFGADDPEEWFYSQVEENLGEKAAIAARVGAPGLLGVSLKGSLALNLTEPPTTIPELLGAPMSVAMDLWEGGRHMFRGETSKGIEKVLPTALASPVKAIREATEGITTRSNLPVYYGDKPLIADTGEAIYRFIGFSPARIASAREKQWNERQVEEKYTKRRSALYAKFHQFYLQPANERTKAKLIDLLTEVKEYNADIIENGLVKKGYSPITNKLLKSNIKRGFKPSKKERLREQ